MIKKNDFVEIEFLGRVKDGEIFDTTIKEEAEKIGLKVEDVKPLVVCVGQNMLVSGFDKALEGKEQGKEYLIELKSNEAFGERDKNLIKTIPLRIFLEKNINPAPGMLLNLDGMLTKIIAVSGGRVIADFNNPLAGKTVVYKFKIIKKIEKQEEKINSFLEFFLKKKFEFKINDKEKRIAFILNEKEKVYENAISMFKDKIKEIFNLDIAFEIKKESREDKKAGDEDKKEIMKKVNQKEKISEKREKSEEKIQPKKNK